MPPFATVARTCHFVRSVPIAAVSRCSNNALIRSPRRRPSSVALIFADRWLTAPLGEAMKFLQCAGLNHLISAPFRLVLQRFEVVDNRGRLIRVQAERRHGGVKRDNALHEPLV